MECRCNVVSELRGAEARRYLDDHLVDSWRPEAGALIYQCPDLRNEWASNGESDDHLLLTRMRMWFPLR